MFKVRYPEVTLIFEYTNTYLSVRSDDTDPIYQPRSFFHRMSDVRRATLKNTEAEILHDDGEE